jgi:hypothetical protein
LAPTAVKALAEGAKQGIKKRAPKRLKQAVAAVNQAAAKGKSKKVKATRTAPERATKASAQEAKTVKEASQPAKKAKKAAAVAKSAKQTVKSRKRSGSKTAKKRSKR